MNNVRTSGLKQKSVNDGDFLNLSTLNANSRRIANFSRHDVFGHNQSVDTTERIISPGMPSATGVQDITLLEGASITVSVASTSANDTSAGTGAQTMLLEGQDAFGNEIGETIILNGQTPVNSTLTYFWVAEMLVIDAGTSRSNEGIIYAGDSADTFTTGVPDTRIYMSMDIDDGLSKTMINKSSRVQNNYHTSLHISSDASANKSVIVKLKTNIIGNSFTVLDQFIISSGLVEINMMSVNRNPPGVIFFLTAQSGTGTVDLVAKLSNIQEDI